MRSKVLTINTYAAGDADGIAASQTPAAGGVQSLTLNGALTSGGVATLDTPRQVTITSAADETARVFVVKGARENGSVIIEAVRGVDTAVASTVQAFKTVSEILVDSDTTGAITAGTATIVSTNWVPIDYIRNPVNLGLLITVGAATASLDVELTTSRIMERAIHVGSEFELFYPTFRVIDHDTLATITANQSGNVAFPIQGIRLVSNAAIVDGPVTLEIVTAGHRGA